MCAASLQAMPPISGAYIVGVTLPTALAVGAYIGLLLLPLIRLARCASAALHPPVTLPGAGAASMPLDTPLLSRLAAWLAVAAPPLVLLLWLRPFAGDLLGLGADARGAAQAAGLLACGAHILPCKSALQPFMLHSGMLLAASLRDVDTIAIRLRSHAIPFCVCHLAAACALWSNAAHARRRTAAARAASAPASLLQHRHVRLVPRQERCAQAR